MGEEQFSDMEFNPMFRIGEHLAVVYPKLARMKFLTTRPKIEIKRTPSAAREEVTKEQWDYYMKMAKLMYPDAASKLG